MCEMLYSIFLFHILLFEIKYGIILKDNFCWLFYKTDSHSKQNKMLL